MGEVQATEDVPVLPLLRNEMCSMCQCRIKVSQPNPLLMPPGQHTKLFQGEENRVPLVIRAGLTSTSHFTTAATALVISEAKR